MKFDVIALAKDIAKKINNACSSEHEALQQAWWLLEALKKETEEKLLIKTQIDLSDTEKKLLDDWINRRVKKEPIQYILGHVPFCNLDILVKKPILIPRPETEEWVSWLLDKLSKSKNESLDILDVGCGTGCIALALAKGFPKSKVIGVDIDAMALALSQENKIHNEIRNASFLKSDFYDQIPHSLKFDLIVSNPPYITEKDWATLSETVRIWENKNALVAQNNGFEAFEKIVTKAKDFLKKDSCLKKFGLPNIVLEIGKGQEAHVELLLKNNDFKNVEILSDMEGINRWIAGGF
jgi:release factor glutamine methyltransferase